jgi:hypothetical protein
LRPRARIPGASKKDPKGWGMNIGIDDLE